MTALKNVAIVYLISLALVGCSTVVRTPAPILARPGSVDTLEERWFNLEKQIGKPAQGYREIFVETLNELDDTQTELEILTEK